MSVMFTSFPLSPTSTCPMLSESFSYSYYCYPHTRMYSYKRTTAESGVGVAHINMFSTDHLELDNLPGDSSLGKLSLSLSSH